VTCKNRREQLSAFTDGELTPAEMAELTEHLVTCPECARYLAELGRLRLALTQAFPEGEVSEEFSSRIMKSLGSAADEARDGPVEQGKVIPFPRRSMLPSLKTVASSAVASAIAATLVFALMKQPDHNVDLAAVRDASLRSSLVSYTIQGAAPTEVAGYRATAARYDRVAGHRARIVTYEGTPGVVTLASWSANGEPAHGVETAIYRGTVVMYWNDGSTEYWAASNADSGGLERFVKSIRKDAI
jgi:anti-sigma factor RsiW